MSSLYGLYNNLNADITCKMLLYKNHTGAQ